MHPHDGVPLLLGRSNEHPVPQEASVVDDHVETAEVVDRRLDELARAGEVGYIGAVRDGFAAGLTDLVHDLAGGTGRAAAAVELRAEVVDDDLGALPSKLQGMGAANAAARARHDDDASFTDPAHDRYSLSMIVTFAWPPPSHMVCSP